MNSTVERTFRWDVDFIGLFLLGGLLLFKIADFTAGHDLHWGYSLFFAGSASLVSTAILRTIGYFDCLRVRPRKSDVLLVLFAMVVGTLVSGEIFNHLIDDRPLALRWIVVWTPAAAVMVFAGHYIHSLIVGSRKKRRIVLKLRPEEIADFSEVLRENDMDRQVEILDRVSARRELRKATGPDIDLVVISRGGARQIEKDRFLIRAHLAGIPIVDRRVVISNLTGRIPTEDTDLWSFISAATRQTELLRLGNFVKTVSEPVFAAVLLVVFSPLFLVVAALIKYTSPGPVIYSQLRTGYLGRTFRLYKFRSMRTDSEAAGYKWATKDDPRITPIGKFIRKTRLDELPQLWNVVKGDMGFVGPRPERPEIYRDLKPKIPAFSLRTNVRPGITGWAQVCAGYAATVEESKLKLEYDLFYIQHMSPRLDLIIVAKTIKVILFGSEYIEKSGPKSAEKAAVQPGMSGLPKTG